MQQAKYMKIQFDSNQEYQQDAVKVITAIFEGQPLHNYEFPTTTTGALLSENSIWNHLRLTEKQVFLNVKAIQQPNQVKAPATLLQDMQFSIEMDTGHAIQYEKTVNKFYEMTMLDYVDFESSEDVEFYFKLPTWFEIITPIGNYRPDWAVVLKEEKKIYFMEETNGDITKNKRK